ncbi:MAG: mannose-1-phosphate guanylyltransferase/mannose-6-phosphate isomerase [Thermodesulfobacteriota bacterium]
MENFEGMYAVVLAGGSGTRLWPMSRTLFPKQLLSLNGEMTLLQQSVRRVLDILDAKNIFVVTNEEHVFEVRKQLRELDENLDAQVLSEPMGRNTLPAILLAFKKIVQDPEASSVAVFPSDHQIREKEAWKRDMQLAAQMTREKWFVTFGIKPHKAETGYGYIALGQEISSGVHAVKAFVEKPNHSKAEEYLRDGGYYWNSGMFIFPMREFLAAVQELQPELYAWWQGKDGMDIVQDYVRLPDISVDYGIMEKVDRVAVLPASFDWDDLGNWEALYRLGEKDDSGCVTRGDVLALDCKDSLLFSSGGKLAAAGLENAVVVQTRDATLVCTRDKVQMVKDVVQALKQEDSHLVEAHVTVYRPWGSYTVLEEGPYYKIKRLSVKPGSTLSLQMHHHRSEHWVVIQGTAEVLVGHEERLLSENQSVDIPKATRHRLANPGKLPVEIIEIQNGPYLEEDDIVRFDDVYGRV